jgi:hypothetical protein
MIVTGQAVCSVRIGLELHARRTEMFEDRLLASPAPAAAVATGMSALRGKTDIALSVRRR